MASKKSNQAELDSHHDELRSLWLDQGLNPKQIQSVMDDLQQSTQPDDDFDIFQRGEEPEVSLPIQAVDYIRDILDLPAISAIENQTVAASLSQLNIPIFLGHGTEDPKTSVYLGEKMSQLISTGLGMDVTWRPYKGLGHWYRVEDEIEDILKFLETRVQIPPVAEDRSAPLAWCTLPRHFFSIPTLMSFMDYPPLARDRSSKIVKKSS
ncbi:uncharacterized protein N7483_007457 [Penicillium malachiteum]|uniref:uncharacterized protein n=1 Tax=Penicillium malachiteum TaxID=1324776 RepID=UPI0025469D2B|nr:uncharacterized protein N7483_007457 [Penicillium malachiteum]KAJ5726100.1 hypothetical protein N7483_007457 [Penicillium malachiteum]